MIFSLFLLQYTDTLDIFKEFFSVYIKEYGSNLPRLHEKQSKDVSALLDQFIISQKDRLASIAPCLLAILSVFQQSMANMIGFKLESSPLLLKYSVTHLANGFQNDDDDPFSLNKYQMRGLTIVMNQNKACKKNDWLEVLQDLQALNPSALKVILPNVL